MGWPPCIPGIHSLETTSSRRERCPLLPVLEEALSLPRPVSQLLRMEEELWRPNGLPKQVSQLLRMEEEL
jgi:hypothetical protein